MGPTALRVKFLGAHALARAQASGQGHVLGLGLGHVLEYVPKCMPDRHVPENVLARNSVPPSRACCQSVVIPIENVVRFRCGPKANHRNSMRGLLVRCG